MKIFLCGLPKSGRSTIAKALVAAHGYVYLDAMSWVRSTFRDINPKEHPYQFEDEYQQYLAKRMLTHPNFIVDNLEREIKVFGDRNAFVIDGISSPRDFMHMFDYRKDIIIFLNRVDNEHEYRDHENIGTSVIRDYCFWMSSAELIKKSQWLEYNFKIP